MIRRSQSLTCLPACGPAAEESLRQQAEALDLLPILVRDSHDAIIYWSRGAQLLYGFTPKEALGRTSQQLLNTQIPESLDQIHARLTAGRPWHGELTQTRKDGTQVFVASQWVPTAGPHGRSSTIIEINTDITEHKRAEAAHDHLAAIVESSDDAIISKTLNGTITTWNAAAERLFGYRADEVLGSSIMLITPPERQAEAAIAMERIRAGEHIEPFETIRLTKGGHRLDVSVTMSPVRDATGAIIGASKIVRDISEHKRVEQAARLAREVAHRRQIEQREQILSAMMEHIPMGIAIAESPDATIRMVSRYGRSLLQKPKEHFVGASAERHPEAFEFFHHDGIPAAPHEMPLVRATVQGETIRGEEWIVARRDGVHIPILCTAAPIRDQSNRIIGGVMGWQDLTRHKQAEKALERAQAELQVHANNLEKTVAERTVRLRETLAEMEAFSYTISHDLRAPIRAIHSFAEIALERNAAKLSASTTEMLAHIVNTAESADRLIQDILSLSRISRQHIQLAPVDLEALLREVFHERPELQASGAKMNIQSPLLSVLGHGPSLRQCFINLLDNAIKFVAPGTQPRIRIWTEPQPATSAPWSSATETGPSQASQLVRVWVEDNGIGIVPEEQGKIFEIFHRAHAHQRFEGTGLGLAIVKKAIERMGGQVGVQSTPGEGSRFWMQLPYAAAQPEHRTGHSA